jgi:hypothetical protein
MKPIILLLGLFLITGSESDQKQVCDLPGQIAGWDIRRCGCCEGWIIIVNDQKFLADSIPNAKVILGPVENRVYPIPVYLSYKREIRCRNRIVITCIQKRN